MSVLVFLEYGKLLNTQTKMATRHMGELIEELVQLTL